MTTMKILENSETEILRNREFTFKSKCLFWTKSQKNIFNL